MIENDVNIKLKLDNLIIEKSNGDVWIPLKDISIIVIDNLKVTLTGRILCSLAEYNVAVVICNQKHLPIGMYSSYDNHSRISKTIGYQVNKKDEYYDKLWEGIVKIKIENQGKVLIKLNKSRDIVNNLQKFASDIITGDRTNREAHAAKIYFNELMGVSFSRGNEDILLNSGLDYGYSIIRSYIAKTCISYGLNTQIGIHHHNEYNRFNLVDDLIEPFRPVVDYFSYTILEGEEYFKPEHRRKLVNILNHRIKYQDNTMYLSNVINSYVSQYAAKLVDDTKKIEFPDVDEYLGEEDAV